MTLIDIALEQPRRLVRLRQRVIDWWLALSGTDQARIKTVALVGLIVAAFHYSLSSLLQTVSYETPLAYVGLVPILAAGLAWLHRVPKASEPAIHDRQLDYIIGLPLMGGALLAAILLPAHMGLMYWFDRIDLLLLPVFVAGATVLLFGFRVAWRQRLATAYLLLAWPWPYEHVLLGTLNGFTNITLAGLDQVLKFVHVARKVPGIDGLFDVTYKGHSFPLSVVTACSGVDGMVGFFLVGVGFAGTIGGGRLRKGLWLALGLVLLWLTNLARLVFIFWAGSTFGENLAINILHPVAGLVIFCIGVGLMLVLLKPFRLSLGDQRVAAAMSTKPLKLKAGTQRAFLAGTIVAVAALALCVKNTQLASFDLVSTASGEPKLTSFLADPAQPAGWTAHYDTEYSINKPLFGQSSRWFRYLYVSNGQGGDLTSSLPVTADVINAGGLSGFTQYGVEACYTFHGYLLRDVAKVDLGSGISGQALSYTGTSVNSDWSIVYWIWPVATSTGTRYERIILYLQNTTSGDVHVGVPVPGVNGLTGALSRTDPQQARLIQNRLFLVALGREIVTAQLAKHDSSADIQGLHLSTPISQISAGQAPKVRQDLKYREETRKAALHPATPSLGK